MEFSKEMGIPQQLERLKIPKNVVAEEKTRGIMKTDRGMSNGLRTSPLHILSDEEKQKILQAADEIQVPKDILKFNVGNQTGFSERYRMIHVRGDILPDMYSTNVRDVLSARAVLAHEYYGHYLNHPSKFNIGDWRDEFRASYRAALDAPGLDDEERRMLMLDAYDRAREAGIPVKYNKMARRMIYGYE